MSTWRKIGRTIFVVCALTLSSVNSATAVGAEEHSAATGGVHADEQAEQPNLLTFQPDLAIFSAIVFLLLLGILSWFAWPQIAAALDERERKIADNIAAAEARHEDAKRLFAEYDARLAAAAGEVRALLDEARRDAEQTKSKILEDGRKAAADETTRALREIERAKNGAIEDLARASANVAIDLARKVVREDLSPNRQNQLVRDALGMLSATTPSKN